MSFAGLHEPWRRKPPRLEVCARTLDGTRFAGRIHSVFSVKREGEGEEPPRPRLPAHFLSVPFSFFLSFSRVRVIFLLLVPHSPWIFPRALLMSGAGVDVSLRLHVFFSFCAILCPFLSVFLLLCSPSMPPPRSRPSSSCSA